MKVLLIDVNCKNSSTGKIVYDIYTELRKRGHQAAIAYGRGNLVREPFIYKFGLDFETYMHAFLARITGINGYFSYLSTVRLIRYIKWFQPDVVHIHELHAYFVNWETLIKFLNKSRIKVVWTFHCEYAYTGKCGHSYECKKWMEGYGGCGKCPYIKDYPKSLFFDRTAWMFKRKKRLLKDFDCTIITPSKWLSDRVRKSFLNDKDIRVINNGIDTSVFKRASAVEIKSLRRELGIPDEHRIFVSVAPDIMSDRKGGKWVVKLAERMRDEKVTFVLVGGKSGIGRKAPYFKEFGLSWDDTIKKPQQVLQYGRGEFNLQQERSVSHNRIRSNVLRNTDNWIRCWRFKGNSKCIIIEKIPQDMLRVFYSIGDVFLQCSEWETFSMTCGESVVCGTIVCGFKNGVVEKIWT